MTELVNSGQELCCLGDQGTIQQIESERPLSTNSAHTTGF